MPDTRSVHVRISGRVQGVNFRAWTARRAKELGLSGWVRNLSDGDVEAVFSGDADAVEAMLADSRRGPTHARVENVEVRGEGEPASGPFTIRGDQ